MQSLFHCPCPGICSCPSLALFLQGLGNDLPVFFLQVGTVASQGIGLSGQGLSLGKVALIQPCLSNVKLHIRKVMESSG